MKRPILFILIGYATGILLYNSIDNIMFYIIAISLFSIIFITLKTHKKKIIIIMFVSLIIGLIFTSVSFKLKFNGKLYKYNDQNVIMDVVINNIKDANDTKVIYAKTKKVGNRNIKTKVIIKIPSEFNVKPGDLIKLKGIIGIPTKQRNPGSFNKRLYALSKNSNAWVYSPKIINVQDYKKKPVLNFAIKIRNKMINKAYKMYPSKHAGLLSGMIIGYTAGLDEKMMEEFSLSGLTHIMAVSGANVIFIVIPLLFILKKLGVNIFLSNILLLPLLFFYVLITGFEASILRASVMASIVFLGVPFLKKSDSVNTICVSCLLLLLYNPFMLFDIGFLLSYGATLGIVLIYPLLYTFNFLKKIRGLITDTFLTTFSATVGILPLGMKFFNIITPYSLFSNLLVVPLTGIITVCGMISLILPVFLAKILSYPITALLDFIIKITHFIANVPGSKIILNIPTGYKIAIYYLSILIFVLYKNKHIGIKKVKCIMLIICILIVSNYLYFNLSKTEITFIDVGQGDSFFIKTKNKTFLIDGGGSYTYEVGENIVIPFLLAKHSKKIDGVFSTHADIDHIGGLISVINVLNVKRLFLPYYYKNSTVGIIQKIKSEQYKISYICSNQTINIDKDTSIKVLWPDTVNVNSASSNHMSLVLLFTYKNFKVLFTGDIDGQAIHDLLSENKNIDCDILQVPHHGAANEMFKELLYYSSPEVAVISVGKNKYGHPQQSILNALKNNNIKYYRTDQSGAITVKTDGNGYSFRTYIE